MKKQLFFLLIILCTTTHLHAANFTWLGTNSSAWNLASNWSGGGGTLPDSADHILISSSATNNLVLDGNRKISNLTLSSKTIDLNGYSLTVYGTATMTSGTVTNGTFYARGNLAAFNGTLMDCPVNADCGYIRFSGSTFNSTVTATDQGVATGTSAGGCIFNDDVTIIHGGNGTYFTLASTTGDVFNADLTVINYSSHEVHLSNTSSTQYKGNIILNSTGTGGITFGNSGGTSTLDSGKTITIGSTGFTNDVLLLKNFTQLGNTAQTLTMTGTAIASFNGSTFNGEITVSSPGILLKNSTFNGMSSFTKTGNSNAQSDGGNVFNGATTISNTGVSGRIRMATVSGDTYNANATFSSTGQDVQIAYSGDNTFAGNITINSNKVVFNTSTGKVTFSGSSNQTLNGSYNYLFKKLAINKSAGTVTANTTLSVDDSLIFIQGNLITTSTNLLTMKHGSTATGASNSSFVSGPVKKVGNTGFWFPVGCFNTYQPIAISAPGTTNAAFIGQYIVDSMLVNTSSRDTTLGFIYRDRYWNLIRETGSSDVYVTLSWQENQPIIDSNIVVVSWNGTKWIDIGKNQINGSKLNGNTQSGVVATSYNEFSIGYSLANRPPTNCDCNDVQTAACLEDCLYFIGSTSLIVSITIPVLELIPDQATWSGSLPMPIADGVTLQGLVSGVVPKWWETGCPLITTNHTATYNSGFQNNMFLFTIQGNVTIQGLRIRGSNSGYKDFNQRDILSGGFYTFNTPGTATFRNVEVSGFSYAGILKRATFDNVYIENSYIHKVKGRHYSGIGYGTWFQSDRTGDQIIEINNTIFDDCKAAIDGQGRSPVVTIDGCTLSQFFHSEDINMHNADDDFELAACHCNTPSTLARPTTDTYLPYTKNPSTKFYGKYWDASVTCINPDCSPPTATLPGIKNGLMPATTDLLGLYSLLNANEIPLYDVDGYKTTIQNCIFHKSWPINGSGNISLRYPHFKLDPTNSFVNISNSTFATEQFEASVLEVKNGDYNAGFAKIADNYILAPVWNSDSKIQVGINSFNYKTGSPLSAPTSAQPFEMSLSLIDGTSQLLPYSGTKSGSNHAPKIQYVEINEDFDVTLNMTNNGGSAIPRYIVRSNPNNGAALDENTSGLNFHFDDERITDAPVTIAYPTPGLYGIDVMGFDVNDYGSTSEEYHFNASAWEHIPVIVVDPSEEQMLYFNIRDSYLLNGAASTTVGVKKQAYFNDELIWEEDIGHGGDGWELVAVDLNQSFIKNSINTDGSPNILSFSIFVNGGLNVTHFRGLNVWIDDIYMKKFGSATGDNLIKDGSIEISRPEDLGTTSQLDRNWFEKTTLFSPACGGDVSISTTDRKSGNNSLRLEIESCAVYGTSNAEVISVGTQIDFTELLSCSDYNTPDFIAFPCSTCTTQTLTDKYKVINDITIGSSQVLELKGSHLAIEPEVKITVLNGGTLKILNDGANNSHLFPCADMWNGIIVEPGGILDIGGTVTSGSQLGTLIQGAVKSIDVNGGTLKLNYATFDHNLLSVHVHNNPTTDSEIFGCKFRCTGARIGKVPFDDHIPYEHVRLENVTNFQFPIGKTTGGTGRINYFSDAYSAIGVYKSSVIIQRNNFDDIYNHNSFYHSNSFGQAINIENSSVASGLNIVVGGNGTNDPNYFTNTNIGVRVLNNSSDFDLSILNNYFDNSNFQSKGSGTNYHNTAITVQNPRGIVLGNILVNSNEIIDFRYGIHAMNTHGIRIGSDLADNPYPNIIKFHLGASPVLTDLHAGIRLQSCNGAYVTGNNFSSSLSDIENDFDVTSTGITNFRGIDIENSRDTRINCNAITNLPRSITFTGHCERNLLRNNRMSGYENAIELYGAYITDQFQVNGGSDEPTDNQWLDANSDLRVTGNLASTGIINWYYKTIDQKYDPDPTLASTSILLRVPGSGTVVCDDYSDQRTRDELFGDVVYDSLEFAEYVDENTYYARMNTYLAMENDTSILYLSEPSDTTYQNFYFGMQSLNVGELARVNELSVIPDSVLTAISINDAVSEDNDIEFNKIMVNHIYLNTFAIDSSLSGTDSTTLEAIAYMNWYQAGDAIYTAASMLFLEIQPSVPSSRLFAPNTMSNPTHTAEIQSVIAVPNPAQDFVVLNGINSAFKLVEIYDTKNNLLKSISGDIRGEEVSLDFTPGIYFIKVTDEANIVYFKKIAIIR